MGDILEITTLKKNMYDTYGIVVTKLTDKTLCYKRLNFFCNDVNKIGETETINQHGGRLVSTYHFIKPYINIFQNLGAGDDRLFKSAIKHINKVVTPFLLGISN